MYHFHSFTLGENRFLFSTVIFHGFWVLEIQGVRAKSKHWDFLKFSASTETTETCNMVMERQFCELSDFERFQNFRPLIKSADQSK